MNVVRIDGDRMSTSLMRVATGSPNRNAELPRLVGEIVLDTGAITELVEYLSRGREGAYVIGAGIGVQPEYTSAQHNGRQ